MVKTSTGLRTHLAVTGSIKAALDGGFIKFYDGAEPANADAAVTGNLLWTVSTNGDGTGLTLDPVAVNGNAVKPAGAAWSGPTLAGTPTYFRFVAPGDDGTLSATQRRAQGKCGNSADSDIYLSSPVLVTDASQTAKAIDNLALSILTH